MPSRPARTAGCSPSSSSRPRFRRHGKSFGELAKRVYAALASPYALIVALGLVAAYFIVGPRLGLPPQPLELSFFLTLATFVLVFLVQHEGYRDNVATQVKLDEIIRALDADRSKIGIEDRPPRDIDSVRDQARARRSGQPACRAPTGMAHQRGAEILRRALFPAARRLKTTRATSITSSSHPT